MRKYLVQIGNINAQSNYTVIAETANKAKEIAKKLYLDAGKDLTDKNIYIAFSRPV